MAGSESADVAAEEMRGVGRREGLGHPRRRLICFFAGGEVAIAMDLDEKEVRKQQRGLGFRIEESRGLGTSIGKVGVEWEGLAVAGRCNVLGVEIFRHWLVYALHHCRSRYQ